MAGKQKTGIPLDRVIFGIFLFLPVIRLISSFFPQSRLWGFNHAGYIDGLFFIYPVLIFIGFTIYWKAGRFLNTLADKDNDITGRKHNLIVPSIIAILSIAGYYLLSTDVHFLGDGYPLISWLSSPNLGLKSRAFGDMKIHQLAAQFLGGLDEEHVKQSFRLLSVFSGAVFVTGLVYYGRKITNSLFSYYTFVVFNLLGAGTILFFGYVELYSLMAAAVYVMMLSAIAALKNNRRSVVPIISFLAAVFFHKLSLVYLPALMIYMALILFPSGVKRLLVKYGKYIILIAIAAFVVLYLSIRSIGPIYWQQAFLPPFGDRFTTDNYYLFSFSHMLDYINLLFLLVPVAVITVVAGFLVGKKEKTRYGADISAFLSVSAVFGLMAAFSLEPQLGMARDWDLLSTMLIGANVAGIYLWIERFGGSKSFGLATVYVGIMAVSIFVPWLALNNSHDGLYAYVRSRVMLDPKHGRTGLEYLITYNNRRRNIKEADSLRIFFKDHFPEKEMFLRGTGFFNRGEFTQAELIYRKVILENPAIFMPYLNLGRVYCEIGNYKKSLEYLQIADGLNPYNADVNFHLGVTQLLLGNKEEGFEHWRNGIYYDSDNPLAYIGFGRYYYEHGIYDSAIYYLTKPKAYNNPGEVLYYVGMSELKRGDSARAIECFKKYISTGLRDSLYYEIQSLKPVLGF